MKTAASKKTVKGSAAILMSALNLCDQNIKSKTGEERARIQAEIDGIQARLKEMGH